MCRSDVTSDRCLAKIRAADLQPPHARPGDDWFSRGGRTVKRSEMRRCVQQRSLRYVMRQSHNVSKAFAQGSNSGLSRVWCG